MKSTLLAWLTILFTGIVTMHIKAQDAKSNVMETNQTIENKAAFAATAFGWFRKDVPLTVPYQYWRDIHGVLAARIPGLYQYRQLHLSPVKGDIFKSIPGINFNLPKEDQPNGIAQLLFLSKEDVQTFGSHPFVTKHIFEDEQYLVERNATQWSSGKMTATSKDVMNEEQPQGPVKHSNFVMALRKRKDISTASFQQYIMNVLVPSWSEKDNVLRLRYHLLESYDDKAWQSPNVKHDWDIEKQYQGWIELVIKEESQADVLLTALEKDELKKHIDVIHAYPVFEKYTLVYKGQPTDVGYRGYPATQIIKKASAVNQQQHQLLAALFDQSYTSEIIKQRNIQNVKNFLRLLEEKDINKWMELWAEVGINYYPYHSGMFPEKMIGKQEIYNNWKGVPEMFDSLRFPIHEIYADQTGNIITIRFDSHNIMKDQKGRYDNTYVCIFEFNEQGKIKEYYEYFNPIITGVTYGMLKVERIDK